MAGDGFRTFQFGMGTNGAPNANWSRNNLDNNNDLEPSSPLNFFMNGPGPNQVQVRIYPAPGSTVNFYGYPATGTPQEIPRASMPVQGYHHQSTSPFSSSGLQNGNFALPALPAPPTPLPTGPAHSGTGTGTATAPAASTTTRTRSRGQRIPRTNKT